MTKDILFNNSNVLYNLRYQVDFQDLPDELKTLTFSTLPGQGQQVPAASIPPPLTTTSRVHQPNIGPALATSTPPEWYQPPPFPPPPKEPQVYDVQIFDNFVQQNPDVKFIYVQWIDYMATIRARVIPIKEFDRMMRSGSRIGISQGNTGTLQNDAPTPVMNPVGQIYVEPDLRSLRRTHAKDSLPSASVMSFWRDERGQPIRECPRANFEFFVNDLQYNHNSESIRTIMHPGN